MQHTSATSPLPIKWLGHSQSGTVMAATHGDQTENGSNAWPAISAVAAVIMVMLTVVKYCMSRPDRQNLPKDIERDGQIPPVSIVASTYCLTHSRVADTGRREWHIRVGGPRTSGE